MILKNSVVYFNISPLLLLVMTVICYFAIRGLNWMAGKRGHAGDFCLVTIRNNGCEIQVPARIDTGNSLKEPFSQFPVVVAEYDCIKTILPDEIQTSWEKNQFLPLEGSRIRIIPFHALGGGGLLPAFRPEQVVVKWPEGSTELSAVYVAVCKIKLSETFHALLNPQILTEGRQIDKGGKKREKGNRSNIR